MMKTWIILSILGAIVNIGFAIQGYSVGEPNQIQAGCNAGAALMGWWVAGMYEQEAR